MLKSTVKDFEKGNKMFTLTKTAPKCQKCKSGENLGVKNIKKHRRKEIVSREKENQSNKTFLLHNFAK